jgi:hypothetical protein
MLPLPSDYGRPTAGFDHVGGDGARSLGPMLGRIDGEVERFSGGGALKAQLNWCNKSENATTDIKK